MRRNIDSSISHLILNKSKKSYCRICITFLLVWIIIESFTFFFIFNVSNHIQNFYSNDEAHMVEIKGHIESNRYKKLNNDNVSEIYDLLDHAEIECDPVPVCMIASGILTEEKQEKVVLYGILENSFLTEDESDDILFTNEDADTVSLLIPQIDIGTDGSILSDDYKILKFRIEKAEHSFIENMVLNQQNDMCIFFAGERTYTKIINTMFEGRDTASLTGLEELVLYVNHIGDVKRAKMILEENNYVIADAFYAFENLPSFLIKANIFMIVIFLILVLFSTAYIFLLYKNYINAQKKDIGILKHYGYQVNEIADIYLWPLKLIMFLLTVAAVLSNALIYESRLISSVVTLMMICLTLIIYYVIKYHIIQKNAKKDILDLVKYDKEFE